MDTNRIERLAARKLFDLSIGFDQFQIFRTALGMRLVAVVGHGRVEGPKLRGEVAPGGGDWLLLADDGVARMDVRASIRDTNGVMLYVTGFGRTKMRAEGRDRFLAGETVTEQDGHMRSRLALTFEASDHYGWLNATVAVGLVSELSQHHIRYHVHAVA